MMNDTYPSNLTSQDSQKGYALATVYPCAKINLGLYVVERRPDGYHNLETVFYPIPLRDKLTVEIVQPACTDVEQEGCTTPIADEMSLSGIPVEGDVQDNLVMRVVRQLRENYPIPPLRIHLEKNIPSGAGLGGGSSDAAFMMRLLNDMLALGLTTDEMEERVSRLGADCAFFIQCQPTMAEGIGNIFSPIRLSLKGMHLVLVKPDDFVSTKEAYSLVRPARPAYDLRQTVEGDVGLWKKQLGNDFETSVLPLHPTIQRIKDQLYELGATYVVMSGSGSSVVGIFDHPLPQAADLFAPHFVFTGQL